MLVVFAIAVGLGGGLVLLTRRPPDHRPSPPPDAHEGGARTGTGNGEQAKPDAVAKPNPASGPPKEVTDVLHYAKEAAALGGGGNDAVQAASKITQEVINGTIGAMAQTQEGHIAASVGAVAAAGVSAWAAYEVFLAATSIAGPIGLAIGTAAVVVTAIVVNLVDAAVTLDKDRQRPFLQAEIDKLVTAGQLREAWAATLEGQRRGIPVGFKVGVPTWGDAKDCVRWPPPGQGDGQGVVFLDAVKVIEESFRVARDAFALDLALPLVRNSDGSVTRPRTHRDSPAALTSKRIGEAWCRYIGGHYESGVADDGHTLVNAWCGLTPWQDQELLIRYYGVPLHDGSTDAEHKVTLTGLPVTKAGKKTVATATAAAGTGASTSSTSTKVTQNSTASGTGSGKQRETDL